MIFGFSALASSGYPPAIRKMSRWIAASGRRGAVYAGKSAGLGGDGPGPVLFERRGARERIVYDGEIYNYSELRLELEQAGFKFTSKFESELVLNAYACWGEGCQNRFNGEWSFAILDEANGTVFCSRDRFGLRPFYYFRDKGVFAFSSGIRTLLRCPLVKRELNNGAVFDYLVLNRANPPDETFFREIRQLKPGCCLSFSPGKGLVKKNYYRPRYNPEIGKFEEKDLEKHASEFHELFKASMKARMRPPYPLGCTLSGGMDSSSIVCMADRLAGADAAGRKKLKVFSIGWKNEAKYIKEVAGGMGLSHRWISPAEAEKTSWEDVKRAVTSAERPLNLTTFFGEIALLKIAGREKIKVMFDGGGGDELLAGYPERYFNAYLNQLVCGGDLAGFMNEFKTLYAGRLREFGIGGEMSPDFYKTFLRTQSNQPQLSGLFMSETLNGAFLKRYARRAERPRSLPPLSLQKALYRDALSLGSEYDTPASVKYRRPFLDHRLAEYVLSLPACYKLHNGWTKYLLRAALSDLLPEKVCWRKAKVGGTVPFPVWKKFLKRNKAKMKAVLDGGKFYSAGFLDQKAVLANFEALFRTAVSPDTTDISGLWRFVNLELWLRENMNLK